MTHTLDNFSHRMVKLRLVRTLCSAVSYRGFEERMFSVGNYGQWDAMLFSRDTYSNNETSSHKERKKDVSLHTQH